MIKLFSILVLSFLSLSAFSQTPDEDLDTLWIYGKSTDKTYGKTAENPVRIGFGRRPMHINRYLNNLTDVNGNHVIFSRAGTVDMPGKKAVFQYSIALPENKYDTLYFDNYSWQTPKLIMGYGWKERREEYYGEYANDEDTLGTGKGLYFYPDGTVFKGYFKLGKRDGLGRIYYPESSDINYMEGLFVDDKQKGTFEVVKRDGSVAKREF